MKKRNVKKLSLTTSTITNLQSDALKGKGDARTCEGPCQGGSGCCTTGSLRCPTRLLCTVSCNEI